MVQVNLVGKKRRERAGRNWIIVTILTLFVGFALYFFGATLYVTIKLYLVDREKKQIDVEVETISTEILANKEILANFVLSKFILDQIAVLKTERFRYKDYLDQVAKLVPADAVLANVDFANKGWVDVAVSLGSVVSLRELENRLGDETSLIKTEFVSVFSESVIKNPDGKYLARLHFQIKSNGKQ